MTSLGSAVHLAPMEPSGTTQRRAWARLQLDVSCGLRRGAWYRVVKLTADEATVQVPHRERVQVPRRFLQTRFARPRRWTVVPHSPAADAPPERRRSRYAVCPICRARAPIIADPVDMRCPGCDGLFGIAWDEEYLTPA